MEKGKKRKAISVESMESLLNPKTVEHWKKYLDNPGVELIIAVHSLECRRAARMLQSEYKVRCHILLEQEKKKIPISTGFKFAFPRFFTNPWVIILILCVFFAFVYSLFAGGFSVFYKRSGQDLTKQTVKQIPPKGAKKPR
ncbi:MAG: hypothetical protein HZA01_12695 [Nitrospinae bacterium]|nr:hypothetical protein [Nitrospinota bacterium]